jgi:leader peptidase (prepilin peptidase)/N-methyltransferase
MKRNAAVGTLAGAVVLAAATARSGTHSPIFASAVVAGFALGTLVAYDLHERRIPNRIVLSATTACAGIDAFVHIATGALITAVAVTAALLGVALRRPTALGMGDAKLALLTTAAFPAHAAAALILGLGLAAIVGLLLARIRGKPIRHTSIPLAPFIAAATALVLL